MLQVQLTSISVVLWISRHQHIIKKYLVLTIKSLKDCSHGIKQQSPYHSTQILCSFKPVFSHTNNKSRLRRPNMYQWILTCQGWLKRFNTIGLKTLLLCTDWIRISVIICFARIFSLYDSPNYLPLHLCLRFIKFMYME